MQSVGKTLQSLGKTLQAKQPEAQVKFLAWERKSDKVAAVNHED